MRYTLNMLERLPDVLSRYSDRMMTMYVLSFLNACRKDFGAVGPLFGSIGPFGLPALALSLILLVRASGSASSDHRSRPGLGLPAAALFFSLIWCLFWLRPSLEISRYVEQTACLVLGVLCCLIDGLLLYAAIRRRNAPPERKTAPAEPETALPPGVTMDDVRRVLDRLETEEKAQQK